MRSEEDAWHDHEQDRTYCHVSLQVSDAPHTKRERVLDLTGKSIDSRETLQTIQWSEHERYLYRDSRFHHGYDCTIRRHSFGSRL